jgi:hypothetical protein
MRARICISLPLFALALALALPEGALPAAASCANDPARTARDLSGQGPTGSPTSLTLLALSDDPRVAQDACDRLRAQGPPGLAALYETYSDVVAHGASDARWARLSAALDRVSGQKDDFASRLFWYTDFDQARAAARQSGRTILSLRIPGRLDGDPRVTGVAARLFRTALYADPDVARILASRYVLHWESTTVPGEVEIDLGDGQVIEQAVTGTSAHYVFDADGRVLDVLPGVEAAAAFRGDLLTESALERSLRGLPVAERAQRLVRYHALRRAVRDGDWPAILG